MLTRALKKLMAGFLVVAASLVPGWAAADVVMHDLVPLLEDHERLRDELLPVVQDCPQVAATIRTQDFTEDEFAAVCAVFEGNGRPLPRDDAKTDPQNPLPHTNGHIEILAFSNHEDKVRYYLDVFGISKPGIGGRYYGGSSPQITIDHIRSPYPAIGSDDWVIWRHEYAHHLDGAFFGFLGLLKVWPHTSSLTTSTSDPRYSATVLTCRLSSMLIVLSHRPMAVMWKTNIR